jgi:TPR repeat protein
LQNGFAQLGSNLMDCRAFRAWVWVCLLLVGCATLAWVARADEDTAKFYGSWETVFPVNGKPVTMLSVHDATGFKNYFVTPTGNIPAGDGTFQAANGKYSTSAPAPNNVGIYKFLTKDSVICTNAAGQTAIWKRVKSTAPVGGGAPAPGTNPAPNNVPPANPAPPVSRGKTGAALAPGGTAPDPSLSPETNAAIAAFNKKDYKTAWAEFMTGAQKGDAEAQAGVGAMLLNHINPPGTGYWAQCEKWLLLSANQGNAKGMTYLAKYYYDDGVNIAGGINPGVNNAPIPPALRAQAEKRFVLARQWYQKAADKGDGYAMGSLAMMMDAGVGGPRDAARAAQLRAGMAGHADEATVKKVTADPSGSAMTVAWAAGHYADALKTARELAAKGDPAAETVIGRSYFTGVGATQSYTAALPWFQKAAAQKYGEAFYFLGKMYEFGYAVPQDLQKAQSLFDEGGRLGYRKAEMEAAGMRMAGEAALQQARFAAVCQKAGGHADGPLCLVGDMAIDPY